MYVLVIVLNLLTGGLAIPPTLPILDNLHKCEAYGTALVAEFEKNPTVAKGYFKCVEAQFIVAHPASQ